MSAVSVLPSPPARRAGGSVLTPLADAVFLLTIFFMLASSYQQSAALDLSLAAPSADAVVEEETPLILRLPQPGQFFIGEEEYDRGSLSPALRLLAGNEEEGGAGRPVLLLAGEAAVIDDLTFALAVVTAAGFTRIGTAQEQASGGAENE